jgi:histone H3/H4
MGKIPTDSIKRIIKNGSNPDIIISDAAAASIAKLLERKAERIAKYAVQRARKRKSGTITEDDIDSYKIRFGD